MSIHYILRTARRLSGLSLRQAAIRAGLLPSTLYRYEEGSIRKVPDAVIEKLLDVYQVNPLQEYEEYRLQQMFYRILSYGESRQEITADFLMEKYLAADERGRQTILDVMMMESRYAAERELSLSEDTP